MSLTKHLFWGLGLALVANGQAFAYDICVRGNDGQVFQASVDDILKMDFEAADSPLRFTGAYTNNVVVGNRAQDISIPFDASMYWIVSGIETDEWFRIGTFYGKSGQNTLVVSVDTNNLGARRTGKFTVLCGFCPIEFTVTQDPDANPENVDILDDNFLNYCLENFDTNQDGLISIHEAAAVKSINVSSKGIKSLVGIRAFSNLEELDCSYNDIDGVLDLSGLTKLERLQCDHNFYSTLNVSDCTALQTLKANDNYKVDVFKYIFSLENVNLKGCSSLKDINMEDNALQSIDLSECVNLEELRLSVNKLKAIDLTHNTKLVNAHIRRNAFDGYHLDLSKCAALRTIFIAESNLASVNVNGCSKLEILDLTYNDIREIDLSQVPALKRLDLLSNQVSELDLSKCPQLENLWVASNNLTALDVSKNPQLATLIASDNKIQGNLNLKANNKLVKVELYKNKLTGVDFTPTSTLEQLLLDRNELTSLDLSGMTNLLSLVLYENNLTELNLKGCRTISVMNLDNNPLSTIDLSDCVGLVSVDMSNCAFTTLDLTAQSSLLEFYANFNSLRYINFSGLDVLSTVEVYNNSLERIDLRGCISLTQIHLQNNNLEYISPRQCPMLSYIDCRNNRIKGIDFSSNDYLDQAFGTGNPCSVVYLSEKAPNSQIQFDESCNIYLGAPKDFNDVGGGNWGDTDIDPWNQQK